MDVDEDLQSMVFVYVLYVCMCGLWCILPLSALCRKLSGKVHMHVDRCLFAMLAYYHKREHVVVCVYMSYLPPWAAFFLFCHTSSMYVYMCMFVYTYVCGLFKHLYLILSVYIVVPTFMYVHKPIHYHPVGSPSPHPPLHRHHLFFTSLPQTNEP